jgi:hypothetical protein
MIQMIATYEYTSYLELAISSLINKGISNENMFAVPLSNRKTERKLFDTLHHTDGISLINKGAILGTAASVVGAGIGFQLAWGPIYWGLIGAGGGFVLGVLIDLFIFKVIKKKQRLLRGKNSEVLLFVHCEESQAKEIEEILWDHLALGIARVRI